MTLGTTHGIMVIMVVILIIVIMVAIHIIATTAVIHTIMVMLTMVGTTHGADIMAYYGGYPYYGYRRGGYYAYNGHTGTANHWGNSPRDFGSQARSGSYDNGRSSYSNRRGNVNQYGNNASQSNDMRNYYDRFAGARQNGFENQTRSYSQPERSTFSQPSPSSFGGARGGGSFGGSYSGGGGSSSGGSRVPSVVIDSIFG